MQVFHVLIGGAEVKEELFEYAPYGLFIMYVVFNLFLFLVMSQVRLKSLVLAGIGNEHSCSELLGCALVGFHCRSVWGMCAGTPILAQQFSAYKYMAIFLTRGR